MPTLDRILGLLEAAIEDYHVRDRWDSPCPPAFAAGSLEQAWYAKAWIDTVQWHLEDEVRRTDLAAEDLLAIKRRIDALKAKALPFAHRGVALRCRRRARCGLFGAFGRGGRPAR